MENSILLKITDLKKKYYRKFALKNISLQIKRGAIIGLLGPNGSGKSTLLKIIAGLLRPSGGDVLIDGEKPSVRTKAQIAYLPEIEHLYGWMSVKETLGFISAFYSDWRNDRALELLNRLQLDPEQKVGTLSRGQKARLKLLLTLSRQVDLVLLDEPLAGIDPPSRFQIVSAIVSEYRTGEQTIILSTHQVGETESIYDEVIFLREGELALRGSTENLRREHGCSIQDLWGRVYN